MVSVGLLILMKSLALEGRAGSRSSIQNKGNLKAELTPGTKGFRIAWNQLNSNYILSSSSDGKAYLLGFDENKDLIVKSSYGHDGKAVFGVSWNNFENTKFATGSDDGIIRIFDTAESGSDSTLQLKGHTNRVFNIVWHPHLPNILASGSNDKTIRVWNIEDGSVVVLEGHENYVRGLIWSNEIPWFLASGSWDSKIRLWDTRIGACITVLTDHHADIYGLDAHPDRPFVYASGSRDNSIRFWNSEGLVNNFKIHSILHYEANELIEESKESLVLPSDSQNTDFSYVTKMGGTKSKSIFENTDYSDKAHYLDQMMEIFDFFSLYDGQNEFLDIMRLIVKKAPGSLHNRVLHISDISCAVESHAKELVRSKSLKIKGQFGKKEDRKRKGAELYLKLGNYKEFGDIMMELGEFDRALAFSPAVSMDYWKEGMRKYGQWLESHEERFTEAPLPYIAINDINTAVDMLTANEEYEDSKLVRALKVAGVYQDIMQRYEEVKEFNPIDHEAALKTKDDLNQDEQLIDLTKRQAEQYFRCGQPILSACSFLSINDYKNALIQLIRANELFLAYILAYLLYPEGIEEVLIRLSKKAERSMIAKEAKELLENAGSGASLSKALMLFRFSRQGLYDQEEHEEEKNNSAAMKSLPSNVQQVLSEILAGNIESAGEMCISQFDELLQAETFENLTNCIKMYEVLQEVQISKISSETKARVFSHLCVIGLAKAIWHGYISIIPGLFNCFIRVKQDIPKIKDFMETIEKAVYKGDHDLEHNNLGEIKFNFEEEYNHLLFESLMKSITEIQSEKSKLFNKPGDYSFLLSGSNVPSKIVKSRKKTSMISDYYIRGYPFILEDGQTYVNTNEALEWALVYSYSPLLNGNRLNPF